VSPAIWELANDSNKTKTPVQAAYLGLARETARLASISFHDRYVHWTGNCAKTIDRLEFTIDIPAYLGRQARSFRLEMLQPNGKWTTAHQGNLYGIIYSKGFPPVSASQVRLSIDAPVTQFDVFPPGL
jgi:hypothetical protein